MVVIALGIIPWTGDIYLRALLVVTGFVFIVAAFPGYEFLLKARRFNWRFDYYEDDDDDE